VLPVVSAGDVLLFSRKINGENFRQDPFGTFMCALIHLTTRSKWNHAALILDEKLNYAEATSEGVVVSAYGSSTDEVVKIPVRYDDDEDRFTACNWAAARVGTRYGFGQAFMCGANNLLVGLGLIIKRTDAVICSEMVGESLWRAGHPKITKDPALISPGDLAQALGAPRK
jgi:uncharacterized protein YycO